MNQHDIVLVNEQDESIGTAFKDEVHQHGWLHRAFSVLIFDAQDRLLLQQRALSKYHCAGLWTNSCCSHPFPHESVETAAHRRLVEELGFDCDIQFHHHFIYRAVFENGLIEHEFDHVFVGRYNGEVHPNPSEVAAVKFISLKDLKTWISDEPDSFTPWFKILLKQIDDQILSVV